MPTPIVAWWIRRDLRFEDNTALYHALESGFPVLPVFIFDRAILDELPENDARVTFLHQRLEHLQEVAKESGSTLEVRYGLPNEVWSDLAGEYDLKAVFTNHDYEPYARQRDGELKAWFEGQGITFHTFRDQVIFEKEEILTGAGKPYTVFTPYSRNWKRSVTEERLRSWPSEKHLDTLFNQAPRPLPSLADMGFTTSDIPFPQKEINQEIIEVYNQRRDYPAVKGTTRLGLHLRFGTMSIRVLARAAKAWNETYLNELIWREFYMQILWNFPHVVDRSFRPIYDQIQWRNDEKEFEKWKNGQTGYPLVDAGMRELNATGYMHNRVRMVVASFLTKHLLIDWRWGEAYFAEKLLDFELASNNGGWQWAAGCGTDAAPYFRVFNPESQMKKFDPDLKYVRKWVPEFGGPGYPGEIVPHKFARERCLATYKATLKPEAVS